MGIWVVPTVQQRSCRQGQVPMVGVRQDRLGALRASHVDGDPRTDPRRRVSTCVEMLARATLLDFLDNLECTGLRTGVEIFYKGRPNGFLFASSIPMATPQTATIN